MREQDENRRTRTAAFLVPPLAVAALLYRAVADLQIALTHPAMLIVAGVCLALASCAGAAAAVGGPVVRTVVLGAVTVLLLDVTFRGPLYMEALTPEVRRVRARDSQRVDDIARIQVALETYIADGRTPPRPAAYGEATGELGFWKDWWDVSAVDQDGDGRPFMPFLVEGGVLPDIPIDPTNQTDSSVDPRRGHQYVYLVSPPGYAYAGGSCPAAEGRGTYMLAITAFETAIDTRSSALRSPGCTCLWKDRPNFFAQHFDYVVCGTFPPSR